MDRSRREHRGKDRRGEGGTRGQDPRSIHPWPVYDQSPYPPVGPGFPLRPLLDRTMTRLRGERVGNSFTRRHEA
jgi:hypothetical protein